MGRSAHPTFVLGRDVPVLLDCATLLKYKQPSPAPDSSGFLHLTQRLLKVLAIRHGGTYSFGYNTGFQTSIVDRPNTTPCQT